jgi:radical SAM protein (TIGR01212 family)
MNELYYSFNTFLRHKFNNQKIRKIPINAGFLCPNKDGKLSDKGCIFCDRFGSGPVKTYNLSVFEQIEKFIKAHPEVKYIAYYQAHTNTYASVEELRKKFEIVFDFKDIVGVFIGTRPDSIKDEVYPFLEELNNRTFLSVELGLQSIHLKSLDFLNRNHSYRQFLDTFQKLKHMNIDVIVHLIVGVPGETKQDMLETIREMNRLKPAGIKFHLMHVLKGTSLYDLYKKGRFKLLQKEEYVNLIVYLLEHLDSSIVIHRLTGERDKELFYAPEWALNKTDIINSIRSKMKELNTFQGKFMKC